MATTETKVVIRAVDRTQGALRSVRRGLSGVSAAASSIQSKLAIIAGFTGFTALTASSFRAVDALAKTADKLGTTTEALAGLQHAGELTGVATQTMNMALQRFTRRAAEAAAGTGEAKDAIRELGIDAKVLNALPLDEKMLRLSDAFANVTNQSDRVRLAFKLFDSEGVSIVNTLNAGSDAMREMIIEAEALGLSVNRFDAGQIENANDAVNRMQGLVRGVGNSLAVELAPMVSDLANRWVQASVEAGGFSNSVRHAVDLTLKGAGVMADGLRGIQVIFKGLELAAAAFAQGFWTAMRMVSNSIALVIEGALATLNVFIEEINKIPLTDDIPLFSEKPKNWAAFAFFTDTANSAQARTQMLAEELHALATQPIPSTELHAWAEEVRRVVDEQRELTSSVTRPEDSSSAGGTGADERAAAIEAGLSTLEEGISLERELLAAWYDEQHELLVQNLNAGKLSEQQYAGEILELREKTAAKAVSIQQKAAKAMTDAEKWAAKSTKDQTKDILGFLSEQSAGLSTESKKAFEINKAASLGIATIKGIEAIQSAYAWGNSIAGPAAGAAAATVAAIAQAANLSAIASTSFGGGGGTGGGGAVGGAISPAEFAETIEPGAARIVEDEREDAGVVININGTINSNDAERLLEDLRGLINDGDHVLIDSRSRNGRILNA